MELISQNYFEEILYNSRAHPVFNKDWNVYTSVKYADTFLPFVHGITGTNTMVFDGAKLFETIPKANKNILKLSESQLISSLIYTYPIDALATRKKDSVQLSKNEVCSFVELNRNGSVDISLKLGSNFKKFLNTYLQHTKTSNFNIHTIGNTSITKSVSEFKKYFQNGSVHKNHMLYVFDLLGLSQNNVLDFIAYTQAFNTKFISYLEKLVIAEKYKITVFIEKSRKDILYKTGVLTSKDTQPIFPEKNEIYIWLVSKDYIKYEPTAEIQIGVSVAKDFIEKGVTKENIQTLIITQIEDEIDQRVIGNDYLEEKLDKAMASAMIAYALQEEFTKNPVSKEVFESSPTAFFAVKAAEFTADSIKKYRISEARWNPHAQGFNPLFKGNTIHNAFFCGIINGLIDLAAGLPEMIGFLSKILHSKSFASEFFDSIKKLIDEEKIIETILEALGKDYKNAKSPEALFYFMAIDVINLISILIGLYGTAVSIQNFVRFTRRSFRYFRRYSPKKMRSLDELPSSEKQKILDDIEEDIVIDDILDKTDESDNLLDDFDNDELLDDIPEDIENDDFIDDIDDLDEVKDPINKSSQIVGKYSRRTFDPDNAGGPILDLNWKNTVITKEGIVIVKKHLSRFDKTAANTKMINRLESVERGDIEITDWDKRFYTHEIREYDRYKNLGYEKTKNVDIPEEVWNNTHTATLEDFKLSEFNQNGIDNLYHPDINDIDFHIP
ncbi:hypothetical protein [Kordia jejudonensis]|uniref:hypothetical protein n=1 Tax=Kordia jejudonensis TaxID=1348245 RepID=UPI00187DAFA3|nr:hypothetical protein [Kordia jejudonensis]